MDFAALIGLLHILTQGMTTDDDVEHAADSASQFLVSLLPEDTSKLGIVAEFTKKTLNWKFLQRTVEKALERRGIVL